LYRVTKPGGVVVWVVGDATINGSETGTSFRQALYFKDVCGFNLHDTMIYSGDKPPLTHNRYEQKFEFMFVLSVGRPRVFNGLKQSAITAGTFRNRGYGNKSGVEIINGSDKPGIRTQVKPEKLIGNVWHYSTGKNGRSIHPAPFPEPLAHDHILSWSNTGDIVLDPFMGSGTTARVATLLGRHYIGFEISADYCEIARGRIAEVQPQLSLTA
jgi:DNA modification methylase